MPPADYEKALEFLLGRINYERFQAMPYRKSKLKLARMQELLRLLGNPQRDLKIVHVAGTKGKGSTCAIISSIACQAGYRVGMFTSPHLHQIEERFRVDGVPCTSEELTELVRRIQPVAEEMDRQSNNQEGPTYFELTTAIALLHFRQRNCDLVILEVGLGGRLDSTNVCHPLVSVITSISFDHTRQLGNTLAKIAAEKAGIIKPKIPVVSGVEADEPCKVIEEIAEQQHAALTRFNRDFRVENICRDESGYSTFDLILTRDQHASAIRLSELKLSLLGRHQIVNSAIAIEVCRLIGNHFKIDEQAIRRGLSMVHSNARVEIVQSEPLVILDAAHNIASVESLVEAIQPFLNRPSTTLVFGTTIEKDLEGMLEVLAPNFSRIILTRYLNNPRATDPNEVLKKLRVICRQRSIDTTIHMTATPTEAWKTATNNCGREDLICVTGSFFIAGEIGEIIESGKVSA